MAMGRKGAIASGDGEDDRMQFAEFRAMMLMVRRWRYGQGEKGPEIGFSLDDRRSPLAPLVSQIQGDSSYSARPTERFMHSIQTQRRRSSHLLYA